MLELSAFIISSSSDKGTNRCSGKGEEEPALLCYVRDPGVPVTTAV